MKRCLGLFAAFFAVSFAIAQKPDLKFRHLGGGDCFFSAHVRLANQDHPGLIAVSIQNGQHHNAGKKLNNDLEIRNIAAATPFHGTDVRWQSDMNDNIIKPVKFRMAGEYPGERGSDLRNKNNLYPKV